MLAWSPILIQKIEIHALGFVLRKLQLNRHRETEVRPHRHAYAQLVLYLSGEGVQTINGRRHAARPGDLFVIPAQASHGFALQGRSRFDKLKAPSPSRGRFDKLKTPSPSRGRPLCLVLDYELEGSGRVRGGHRRLPPARLNALHASLARVPPKGRLTLSDYPAILAVVAQLLESSGTHPTPPRRESTVFDRVQGLLRTPGARSLAKVSRQAGYHPDHLTRKLKRETGLGLRALRDRIRLESAQAALRSAPTVAEAATQCGFEDPNYFARWFRQQTGQPPSRWKK